MCTRSPAWSDTSAKTVCCRMVDTVHDGSVIVSSEALSEDPGWTTFKPNSMVLLADNRVVRTVAL